jgi:amino acid adenylation domain-containing protein
MKEPNKIPSALSPESLKGGLVSSSESARQPLFSRADPVLEKGLCGCVHELIEVQAGRTPGAIAVVHGAEALSYQELNERANAVAERLRRVGVGPDKLVGIYVERSVAMVVGMLGVLKAGGAYVPMDPKYPAERVAFMLGDAQPVAVVTQSSLLEQLPAHGGQVVCVDAPDESFASQPNAGQRPTAGNLAYVIYTSGSTGQPKGVAIEHRNAVNFIYWARSVFSDAELAGVLAATSICFDLSVFELFVTLSWGGQVILAENALELPRLAAKAEVTLINTVPSAMAELVRSGGVPAGVQVVNLAGEPLATALVDQIYALKHIRKVHDLYGPTETTTYSTFTRRQPGAKATIGRPLANTQVYVLDEHRQPVPVGVAGELYIGGAGVARGYLHRPELTAEKFLADPFGQEPGGRIYKTGDLVRYQPDGQLEFIGRIDQQVKVRGYRIELGEIEAVLQRHPAVREAVVVAWANAAGEKELVAYLTGSSVPAVGELRAHLLKTLPDYMVPVAFVTLSTLPLTPNGKIDRQALPAPAGGRFARPTEVAATATEQKLAQLWSELLGVEKIGRQDNYFELGGHSLLAVRMIFRLRDELGVELPVKAIAAHPTIAALSLVVEAAGQTAANRLRPEAAEARHQASFNQEQLWFLDQLAPGSAVYNVPLSLRLRGPLNRGALEQSLNHVLRRHEILRTTFVAEQGAPVPVVVAELKLELPPVDLTHLGETERESEAQRRLQSAAASPFDLSRGPLVRVELFRLGPAEHVLLVVIHHIVFDGWSVDVLLRELAAGYTAFAAGRPPALPALPVQYADFAAWQRRQLNPATVEHHLNYWRQHLAHTPTILDLPTDRERAKAKENRSAELNFKLSSETAFALRKLGQQNECTPFVILLAAFHVLLYRCARQEQILIGVPFAGRTGSEVENLIGFFVNSLPVKADFSQQPSFLQLLRQVRDNVWAAQEHQELAFEQLVRNLQPAREINRNPFFQVSVVPEVIPPEPYQMSGLSVEVKELPPLGAMFDLTLQVTDRGNELSCVFSYNADLFERSTAMRLVDNFQKLTAAVLENPQRKVSEIQIITSRALDPHLLTLSTLPLTPNGKIDRQALPAPAGGRFARPTEVAATATEQKLAQLWSELLGVEKIGRQDNYFELGGHSLLAVRMIFRLRDELGVELPVKAIAAHPTIAALSLVVEAAGQTAANRLRPEAAEARHQASFNQEQLWFLDQLAPGSAVYNVPLSLRLRGPLNRGALEQSLNHVLRRHEILRTTFVAEQGAPVPVVVAELKLELPPVDLTHLGETERESEAQRRLQSAAASPFDLSRGPLVRAELFRLGPAEHVLLVVIHHIVFDGWSVDVLLRELAAGYTAFAAGRTPALPNLPVQYADFAAWQRRLLNPATVEHHLNYWRQHLAHTPTILDLPTDKIRPPVADHRGAHQSFTLPAELTVALRELGRQQGTTFFVTLLAAFQTLLHRFSGQPSILVGSPMSGRTLPATEDVIGLFMNALPLKADFSGNLKFTELLRQVHETVWAAQDHQELPFDRLVQEFQPHRDLSRNPIFQTSFVFESASLSAARMGEVNLEWEFLRIPTIKLDLTLVLAEKNGRLEGVLEYATGIFAAETITRLLEYYQNLLAAIAANPQELVANLRLLSESERHQLLTEWNATTADYPRDQCIHQLFEAQAKKTPDAIALVCDEKTLTYQELNRRANQVAHHLRKLGIGPDGLAGIFIERSPEMIIGLLGILKAGGAYVPLDIKNPKLRLQQQLYDVKALVTQTELLPRLPAFDGAVVCLDRDRHKIDELPETNPELQSTSENLAYVIYTSGSTGVPKGVAIRHRNLVNYAYFISRRLGLETFASGLKFASVSSIAADLGNTCIYPALISGGSLHVVSSDLAVNPEAFARYASRHEIDVLKITPSHLAALITGKNSPAMLPRRFLILGGEALTPQLVAQIRNLAGTCRIINHYGPTETTVGSLMLGEEDFGREQWPAPATVPIGRPIANTQAYILDANLQPVPFGLRGQLFIGGDGVAQGYYNSPELTAEKFIRNPFSSDPTARLYATGDLARYLPDGRIEFLGRKDHQVKIRGFRIELGEIETAVKEYPGVGECVLAVQERELGDNWLVAYLVPARPQILPEVKGLRDFLRQKLPDYMIPAAFVNLEKLPLTSGGKIDRRALPVQDWSATKDGQAQQFDWPRTPLELQILLIWQRILNVKTISIRDNFFDLGGHSLLAVQLVSEVNKSLQQSLAIPTFFQNPTVEGMAQILERENPGSTEPRLIPLQPGSPSRALFFLDASMGQCRLAQLLDTAIASFATILPLPASVVQAAALNKTDGLPTVEELAAYHTALIQKHQPTGSCLLAGHSFGGLLAFEVAHQLQRQGRTVEMIFLLDSWATHLPWWRKLKVFSFARVRESIQFRARHWWSKMCSSKAVEAESPKPVEPANPVHEEANQPVGDVSWEILERVYRNARKNYRLRPLASRAIVFRAQASEMAYFYAVDPALGWQGLLTRGIEVIETPGDHFSLLKRPHLLTLADHFKKYLKSS